jgi:hypothetical protein
VILLTATIIFVVLAIAVPISINNRPHISHVNETTGSLKESPLAAFDGEDAFAVSHHVQGPSTDTQVDSVVSNSMGDSFHPPLLHTKPVNSTSLRGSDDSSNADNDMVVPIEASLGSSQSTTPQSSTISSASFDLESEESTPGKPVSSPSVKPSLRPLVMPSWPKPSLRPSTAPPASGPFDAPAMDLKEEEEENITFVPGLLSHLEQGLLLSKGLTARIIAQSGKLVEYQNTTYGNRSTLKFHEMPDFGATFKDKRPDNPGGFVYVSNSEMETPGAGAVGSITFDRQGNVLRYEMLLNGTTKNCGGGKDAVMIRYTKSMPLSLMPL